MFRTVNFVVLQYLEAMINCVHSMVVKFDKLYVGAFEYNVYFPYMGHILEVSYVCIHVILVLDP